MPITLLLAPPDLKPNDSSGYIIYMMHYCQISEIIM